jgi:hypothetical protein
MLLILLVASDARADRFDGKPPAPSRKSPAVLLGWSLGVTAVGSAVLFGGLATDRTAAGLGFGTPILVFAPSIVRGSAGGPMFPGLLIRGLTGTVALTTIATRSLKCTDECAPGEDRYYLEGQEKAVVYGAAGIFFASLIWDVVQTPLDAREYNREHGFALMPTAVPGGAGIALGGEL